MTIPKILESKRFVTALVAVLVELIILFVPQADGIRLELMEIVAVLFGLPILLFGGQDWLAAYKGTATKYFDPTPKAPVG
jgi:hypothetical protein